MQKKRPVALIILDGFGYNPQTDFNAIAKAHKPNLDAWFANYPHTLLKASGAAVGLPDGYIGNSEVGHTTIGAGRIVEQPITRIERAIADTTFFKNPVLVQNLKKLKENNGVLHIMGLLSDAGVHSDIAHLYALLDAARQQNISHVYIHAFLDGRDTPPKSASRYLEQLDDALMAMEYGSIGSIHGRFYAMDRDNHWDRTEKSYDALTDAMDTNPLAWEEVLKKNYPQGITDEFIPPVRLDPTSRICDGDGIIFFNIRPDRARQLTAAFIDPQFDKFKRTKIDLSFFISPVSYGDYLKTQILFATEPINDTLKEMLNGRGKTIFSIAETEKYAHITYFFGGGKEMKLSNETRVLIPSLGDKKYDEHPCMSAPDITNAVLTSLNANPCDFYLINYANSDMVGHSGNMQATVKAIECLDTELKKLYDEIVLNMDGTMIITADHGNAEEMYDLIHKQPKTSHTANPVPFLFITKEAATSNTLPLHELKDIAPFILKLMGIKPFVPSNRE